ncbi:MAG: sugar ABC transporter permease [Clostridiales bacterium]|nr:sugar ABC transporter permease [Clostridiales bacterium]
MFREGDLKTRLGFLIMGFGSFMRGQIIKGLLFLTSQAIMVWYVLGFASQYLSKLDTLGDIGMQRVWSGERQNFVRTPGDNSLLILLFSVMSIMLFIAFIALWHSSIRSGYKAQKLLENKKRLPSFSDDIKSMLNDRFHFTLMSLPSLMVIAFTILPTIFMILIAFTNFDSKHQPPGNMFTWVGFENFSNLFGANPLIANTFSKILGWTMVWAVIATVTNYLFGMLLAIFINNKHIKLKAMWRTIFVITIAVPQFVSLMLMSQILHQEGPLNALLKQFGFIQQSIPFITDINNARLTVLSVNLWVGIPYTMLITSGILMNIPKDLYESASIDGASPLKMFVYITLPYMLFITTPYLITAFVGNINNFNVIFLLTRGGPLVTEYYQAGKTDLLVTWLYRLTVEKQDYSLASTIGIFVFFITAGLSLLVFNLSGSTRREEEFQ